MYQLYPASLFKRIVALAIDLGILYFIGFIIFLIFGDILLFLGRYKIIIGILISTIYFTYSHSYYGKGQTLGKKLFNFQVLKLDDRYLSVKEAFIRSIIFTIPYCLSDMVNIQLTNSIGIYQFLSYTLIPAVLFANHYFIFTNPLRQCYYDLILSSFVSGPREVTGIDLPKERKIFKLIPLLFIALVLIVGLVYLHPFSEQNRTDLRELSEIKSTLDKNRSLHFSKFYYDYKKNDSYNKELKIECFLTRHEDITSEIYLITEELEPVKSKYNIRNIVISIVKDFNIGIYNSWEVLKKNKKPMKFDI